MCIRDSTVTVKYSGDNNYNAAVAASSFTVSKVDSTMDVTVNDIVFGWDLTVEAVLPDDATGAVSYTHLTGAELRKNSSTLTVSNTIFKDNSALYAGAVYIWGSNYNICLLYTSRCV